MSNLPLLDGIVLGLILGAAAGGRLSALDTPLRFAWLPVTGALVVTLASRVGHGFELWLWIAGLLLLLSWAVVNARLRGFPVLALGLLANIMVVALNGGMPVLVSSTAIPSADTLHVSVAEHTHLPALADIIPLAGPRWHAGLVSIGDILAGIGAAIVILALMREVQVDE